MIAAQLQELLEAQLQSELAGITESQARTQSGMTHAESRAENDKDTRAIESSYLARGLAQRVVELRSALATIQAWVLPCAQNGQDTIGLGTLVEVEDEENEQGQLLWLAPAGGGQRLQLSDQKVLVLTPQAPLGQALMGRRLDDEVEVQSPSGKRCWLVVSIRQ